jgi:hypothetical protein
MADYPRFNAKYLYGTNNTRDTNGDTVDSVYGIFGFWWPLFLDRSEAERVDPDNEVYEFTFFEYSYSKAAEEEGIGEWGENVPFYMPRYAYTATGGRLGAPLALMNRPSVRMLEFPPPIPGGFASYNPDDLTNITAGADQDVANEILDKGGPGGRDRRAPFYDPRNAVPGQDYEFLPPPWYPKVSTDDEARLKANGWRVPAQWERASKYFDQGWPDDRFGLTRKAEIGLLVPEERGGLDPLPVPDDGVVWRLFPRSPALPILDQTQRRTESLEATRTEALLDYWSDRFKRWFFDNQGEDIVEDEGEAWQVGADNFDDTFDVIVDDFDNPAGPIAITNWPFFMAQGIVRFDSLARDREESIVACKNGYIPDYIIPHWRDESFWKSFGEDIPRWASWFKEKDIMNVLSLKSYGDWVEVMNVTSPGIKRAKNTDNNKGMRSDIVIQWASPYDGKELKRPTQKEYERDLLFWREYYRRRAINDARFEPLINPDTFVGGNRLAARAPRSFPATAGQCYQLKKREAKDKDKYISALKDERPLGGWKIAWGATRSLELAPDPIGALGREPVYNFPHPDICTWPECGREARPPDEFTWAGAEEYHMSHIANLFTCPSGPGMLNLKQVLKVPYMVKWGGPGVIKIEGIERADYNFFNLGWEWSPIGTPIPMGVAIADWPGVGGIENFAEFGMENGNWHEVYPDSWSPGPYSSVWFTQGGKGGAAGFEVDWFGDEPEQAGILGTPGWNTGPAGGWMGPTQPWELVANVPLYYGGLEKGFLDVTNDNAWYQVWPLSPVENEEDFPSIIRKKNSDLGFKTIIFPGAPGEPDPNFGDGRPGFQNRRGIKWAAHHRRNDILTAASEKEEGRITNIEDFRGVKVIHLGQGGRVDTFIPPTLDDNDSFKNEPVEHPIYPGLNWAWED